MDTEKTEKNVALKDLQKGDKVTLRHSGKVTVVNTLTGHVRLDTGAHIRMTNGAGMDRVMNGILFEAERTHKAASELAFKPGQVWKNSSGKVFFIMSTVKPAAYDKHGVLYTLDKLVQESGLVLVADGSI